MKTLVNRPCSLGAETQCSDCPKNTFSISGAFECASGTYSLAGAAECTSCEEGKSSSPGSSSCQEGCPAGQFGESSSSCTYCPEPNHLAQPHQPSNNTRHRNEGGTRLAARPGLSKALLSNRSTPSAYEPYTGSGNTSRPVAPKLKQQREEYTRKVLGYATEMGQAHAGN
ncbi:hypothetical protein TL16_g11387 [Triparma laevis f. inornata]|uniref:Tyrosine-protein kinase ephrin type A/B receptor-like domain-containing protein n=1 Tax=Triparma laevis f. inornata TaxID=1714386 RepID=A0A9W7ERS3_9STRA|nr:hypothetical protein TL16_g11387 [Triparma laevis f. inornata]